MRLAIATVVLTSASSAHAYFTGPAVALEELAKQADIVCKGTVVSDKEVADNWFEPHPSYRVHETVFTTVSCVKGKTGKTFAFRHYAPGPPEPNGFTPANYSFAVKRSYIVFAKAGGPAGSFRMIEKWPTMKVDDEAVLGADDKPHRGSTATEAVQSELRGLLASKDPNDVLEGIKQIDERSGGQRLKLADFDRLTALSDIAPKVASTDLKVAQAAIDVFGEESPYYRDEDAGYWLAGMGKGSISGLGPRKPVDPPAGMSAITQLTAVADGKSTLRAAAIRALGRVSAITDAKIAAWAKDPDIAVRRAAILISANRADHSLIKAGAKDLVVEIRAGAALAIGFSQDAALLPLLQPLVTDPDRAVHMNAAMALLSFSFDVSKAALAANLKSDYRSLFVNLLAAKDAKPYLALLAEIIAKKEQPKDWWGGQIPAGESWGILFKYAKTLAAKDLAAFGKTFDAMEKMEWYSSSEPRDLYAFYVVKVPSRAAAFRKSLEKSPLGMKQFLDEVDKNPKQFIQP